MANVLFISYDNGSHIPFFPQNIYYLNGALRKQGHQVGIWFQDIHHGRPEDLRRLLNTANFDIVALGFVAGYYQYKVAKELSKAINESLKRDKLNFVLGGHGPAGAPEYFLKKFEANTVVIGDGEEAICDIASTNCQGILQGTPCNTDESPIGTYQDFPMDIYRLIQWPTSERTDFCFPILSSRGCKWHCSFCYRMREGYHMRSVESIMEEIKYLHNQFQVNHFQFSDELLMASEKRTEEVCESLLELPFAIKWDCNGRLNYAKSSTLIGLMKKSGCEYVNYGIESLNQSILNGMRKGLTVEQIYKGVETTLQAAISPGLNLIWGFPGDTIENLDKAVEFLLKYDPCHELRTIRPVTPYPGCPLYYEAIEKGLLDGPEDFYERKHINSDLLTVNFTDIPDKEFHWHLKMANRSLYRNYLDKRWEDFGSQTSKLYSGNAKNFRGFRIV